MLEISVGSKKVTLNVEGELKVKDYRKIYPIMSDVSADEITKSLKMVEALSANPKEDVETVDNMNMDEFAEFSSKLAEIFNQPEKKTGE